jgi:uncharacterized protein
MEPESGWTMGRAARARVVWILAPWLAVCLAACGNDSNAPPQDDPSNPTGPTPPASSTRLLVVTHTAGFRHDSIPTAESVLRDIGTQSGLYQAEFVRTADDVRQRLTTAGLANVDAVFFANTTGNLGIPDMPAFLAWVSSGHAVLGAHSATDTYHDDPSFLDMLGGEFAGHGAVVQGTLRVDDPSHPAVAHLVDPPFAIADEWYRFTRFSRNDVRVVLSMERNPNDSFGTPGALENLPLAWHKSHGGGRVFYTALGHESAVWQNERFRRHLEGAIRWALGLS